MSYYRKGDQWITLDFKNFNRLPKPDHLYLPSRFVNNKPISYLSEEEKQGIVQISGLKQGTLDKHVSSFYINHFPISNHNGVEKENDFGWHGDKLKELLEDREVLIHESSGLTNNPRIAYRNKKNYFLRIIINSISSFYEDEDNFFKNHTGYSMELNDREAIYQIFTMDGIKGSGKIFRKENQIVLEEIKIFRK